MANSSSYLSWEEAIEVLDKNFDIKNSPDHSRNRRSYRTGPNDPSLEIQFVDGKITVKLPRTRGGPASHEITNIHDLTNCIKLFNGTVSLPKTKHDVPQNDRKIPSTMIDALNTILYGPPGTGKTFKTAEIAVKICDGEVGGTRHEIMKRYEELRKEERINFVTFHQSYGYEDFVEGLKPESIDGQITYPVRPGIFRKICEAAKRSALVKPGLTGKSIRERTIYKMSLGRAGTSEGNIAFRDCIKNGYVLLGWGDHVDFSECRTTDEIKKKLLLVHPVGENPDSQARYVEVFKNEMRVGDIVVVSQGNRAFRAIGEVIGGYEYLEESAAGSFHQMRPVRWLAVFESNRDVAELFDRNFMQSTLYKLDHAGLRLDVLERLIKEQQGTSSKNFVLIIDEINRANISKVFGELITLLEADKRENADNALTIKLPYSGDDFSVPPNLFIVGTMNTADRSIALLDTALRRRFDFEELMPDPKKLAKEEIDDGINLEDLLTALNRRIEVLYDRDHTIGHAFFIDVTSLEELEFVFRRKVIPLLQEYFYENWSNVRRVLNDLGDGDFVLREQLNSLPADGDDAYADEPRTIYRVNKQSFPVAAFKRIYGGA